MMDIGDDKQTEAFWCDVCASRDAGGGVGAGRAWQQQRAPQAARAQNPSKLPGTKDRGQSPCQEPFRGGNAQRPDDERMTEVILSSQAQPVHEWKLSYAVGKEGSCHTPAETRPSKSLRSKRCQGMRTLRILEHQKWLVWPSAGTRPASASVLFFSSHRSSLRAAILNHLKLLSQLEH